MQQSARRNGFRVERGLCTYGEPMRVAVIGGGLAGLEAAEALVGADFGAQVTIFERGSFMRTRHVASDPQRRAQRPRELWSREGQRIIGGGLLTGFGGRSLHYQGVTVVPDTQTLQHWPQKWREMLLAADGSYHEFRRRQRELSSCATALNL